LREAARQLGHWRVEATLVVTQEPCPMCAGAIVNARVAKLIYGCANPKAGAVTTLYQITTDRRLNHRVDVIGGVLADECAAELSGFFAKLRRGPAFDSER
jgi:tRNA(adenine34) deaminase